MILLMGSRFLVQSVYRILLRRLRVNESSFISLRLNNDSSTILALQKKSIIGAHQVERPSIPHILVDFIIF